MTEEEQRRLTTVEQQNIVTNKRLRNIESSIKDNTTVTRSIEKTLDELTGAKKFLVWFTSFVVGIGIIIATVLGFHHK